MPVVHHEEIEVLMDNAYKVASKKMECVDFLKKLPSVFRVFSKSEVWLQDGFVEGLKLGNPDKVFYCASFAYGSAASYAVFFTDPIAIDEAIRERYPMAPVQIVLTS